MSSDIRPRFELGVLLFALAACSSDDAAVTSSDGGPSSGGMAGGSGGSAGSAGSPTAGAGGVAGAGPVSCAGTWSTTSQVLLRTASAVRLASPALSPDELEMFYSASDPATAEWHFRRSVRSAKTAEFPEGAVVPELDAACPSGIYDRTMDLSRDGLRAYVACYLDNNPPREGPLRVARRTAVGSPWTLDPSTGPQVGPSLSVSSDELTLYSSTKTRPAPPLAYMRTSTSTAFGDGVPVPGLESSTAESLDASPDGISILGYVDYGIAVATRSSPSGPFGSMTTLLPGRTDDKYGSPDISRDCRSLYYIHVAGPSAPFVYTIEVRTR